MRGRNVGGVYSGYSSALSVSLNAVSSRSRFAVILPVPPGQKPPSFSFFSAFSLQWGQGSDA